MDEIKSKAAVDNVSPVKENLLTDAASDGKSNVPSDFPYDIKCIKCATAFESYSTYEKHFKICRNNVINKADPLKIPENVTNQHQILMNPNKTGVLRCEVCNNIFSGNEPYQQHMNSIKHQRNVKRSACYSDILTGQQSPSSVNAAYPSVDQISFPNKNLTSEWFSHCEVCNKNFSGPEPYTQHINSIAHKKKVTYVSSGALSLENFSVKPDCNVNTEIIENYEENAKNSTVYSSEKVPNFLPEKSLSAVLFSGCDICKKNFSGPESYNQHINSIVHKKKVAQSLPSGSSLEDFNSKLGYSHDNKNGKNDVGEKAEKVAVVNVTSDTVLPAQWFSYCKLCEKSFSGPEPYTQHINSIAHKKKAVQNLPSGHLSVSNFAAKLENPSDTKNDEEKEKYKNFENTETTKLTSNVPPFHTNMPVSQNTNSFYWEPYCKVCAKSLSGYEPYVQHINSYNHKKKVQGASFIENNQNSAVKNLEADKSFNIVPNNPFKCDLCSKSFTGIVPFQMHMSSDVHAKIIKKLGNVNMQNYEDSYVGELLNQAKYPEKFSEIKNINDEKSNDVCEKWLINFDEDEKKVSSASENDSSDNFITNVESATKLIIVKNLNVKILEPGSAVSFNEIAADDKYPDLLEHLSSLSIDTETQEQ